MMEAFRMAGADGSHPVPHTISRKGAAAVNIHGMYVYFYTLFCTHSFICGIMLLCSLQEVDMRQRVTYTLPVALVEKLSEVSKQANEAQSRIVESALRKELLQMEKADMDRLAEIGYSAMGEAEIAEAEADMGSWSQLIGEDDWGIDWGSTDE